MIQKLVPSILPIALAAMVALGVTVYQARAAAADNARQDKALAENMVDHARLEGHNALLREVLERMEKKLDRLEEKLDRSTQ